MGITGIGGFNKLGQTPTQSTVPQSKSISPFPSPYRAFSWTSQLTKVWTTTYLSPHPNRCLISATTPTTPLSTIEHLVLLTSSAHRTHTCAPTSLTPPGSLTCSSAPICASATLLDPAKLGNSFFCTRGDEDVSLGYMGGDHIPVFMSWCERAAHHR
jgi:hypothetical protein